MEEINYFQQQIRFGTFRNDSLDLVLVKLMQIENYPFPSIVFIKKNVFK